MADRLFKRKIYAELEKPSVFDPRGQATLPLTGKIRMTLCDKLKLTSQPVVSPRTLNH